MPFLYTRRIRFHETDAAGVVYFANLLTLCHEAYEAALAEAGFDLTLFFSKEGGVAVLVTHTEADFYQPLRCGEAIALQLVPTQVSPHSFEIHYEIYHCPQQELQQKPAVRAMTRHVCIDVQTRRRQTLTPELTDWITGVAGRA
ncbi:MAG: thioesterase family protein [Cyanobacteria bacterium J06634_6]